MIFSLYNICSFCVVFFFSLILTIEDIKTLSANIYLQWISVFFALTCHLIFNRTGMWIFILSSMITGSFYFAVRKITKNKLGPADVWFGFFQGLFLIPQMIAVCFAAEVILTLIIMNKKIGHKAFPFIPFMAFGLITAYIIQIIFFTA